MRRRLLIKICCEKKTNYKSMHHGKKQLQNDHESWSYCCRAARIFGTRSGGYLAQFQRNTTKMCLTCSAVSCFYHFLPCDCIDWVVKILLELDKSVINPTTWFWANVKGKSFVLFDVSIVIFRGHFHYGNKGHTQNAESPWVKSFFPVGKRSWGTATKIIHIKIFFYFIVTK